MGCVAIGGVAKGAVDDLAGANAGADVSVVVETGILPVAGGAPPAAVPLGREKATLSAKRPRSSRAARSAGVVAAVADGGRSGSPRAGLDGLPPALGATASLVRCRWACSAARRRA